MTSERFIRIADPDAPIYRIFPLWFLEEALRLRQLVLVSPSKWEDPYETIGQAIAVNRKVKGRFEQLIINQSLPPMFAQSWSSTAESDTLLRAYSRVVRDPHFGRNICPRDEGVRVKSTSRKLLDALIAGSPPTLTVSWFLGSVKYLNENALLQEVANAIGHNGVDVFSVPANRAKLLLLKRHAFSHESEVRAICVHHDSAFSEPVFRVSIDPMAVFDEVTFDPRLQTFERREREAVIRSLGFDGHVGESGLYQGTLLEVELPESPESD